MTSTGLVGTTLRRYGRSFDSHSVEAEANVLPIDEKESEREKEWHDILKTALDERLRAEFRSPVFSHKRLVYARVDRLESVLDVGYGTGVWAEDLAEDLREIDEEQSIGTGSDGSAEDVQRWKIFGVDITRRVSGNGASEGVSSSVGSVQSSSGSSDADPVFAARYKWDLNQSLTNNPDLFVERENMTKWAKLSHDLVNIRCLTEGVRLDRWELLLRESCTLLRPHGWIQIVELALGNIQSSSGRLDDALGLQEWTRCYREGLRALGRTEPHLGKVLEQMLTRADFEEISSQSIQLDIGDWRKREDGGLSTRVLDVMETTLTSLGLWPTCAILGKSEEEFHGIVQRAMQDLRNPDIRPYLWCYVFVARKPDPQRRKRKSIDNGAEGGPESSSMAQGRPPLPGPFRSP